MRRPLGRAEGALSGSYPDPALGLVMGVGPALFDDFPWVQSSAARPGSLQWIQSTITTAPTYSDRTGTDTEVGVRRIATAATINTGGVIRSNVIFKQGIPAIGAEWYAKIRGSGTLTNAETWSGFGSSLTLSPVVGSNMHFVGVRREGAGNWFGVTKTGAGAGAETTVDLGVNASGWQSLGFDVVDTGGGVKGVQFYVFDLSSRRAIGKTPVGAVVTTHLTTGVNLYALAIGQVTRIASSRIGEIDFWGLGGRTAR